LFIRDIHNWEVDLVLELLAIMYEMQIPHEEDDVLVWIPSPLQGFQVQSRYCMLRGGGRDFPWKSIWRVQAPPRVAFFTWCVALSHILTADNR
jgi:hypothetical protein